MKYLMYSGCIVLLLIIAVVGGILLMKIDPIADNPSSMTLINADGTISVESYIKDGTVIHEKLTGRLASCQLNTEANIRRANEFIVKNVDIDHICAALKHDDGLEIIYNDANGVVANLNKELDIYLTH
ncbi:MAG: hypothetical protein AB7F40_00295 [Victivallaceae bacterium]